MRYVLINKPTGHHPAAPLGGFPQEASRGPSAAGRDRSLENNGARLLLWKTPSFMPEANPCQKASFRPPFLPVSSQTCRFSVFAGELLPAWTALTPTEVAYQTHCNCRYDYDHFCWLSILGKCEIQDYTTFLREIICGLFKRVKSQVLRKGVIFGLF